MKKQLLGIAAGLLTLTLAGQLALHSGSPPSSSGEAVWAFQPTTFAEVVSAAQTIVEAEVVAVAAGPDIVVPLKDEPNGEDRTATTQTTVRVLKALKGKVAAGDQLVIFRTGSQPDPADRSLAENRGVQHPPLVLADDPPYLVGQRCFLLLTAGPNDTLRPVSPEGRYTLRADDTLAAVSGSAVAQSVNARTRTEVEAAATGQLQIPTRPLPPETHVESPGADAPAK